MTLKITTLDLERQMNIINAASKEFATNGYNRASTNIIAKNAGISKGLLFHYVNNKKDLFLFVYEYCKKEMDKEYLSLMNFEEKDLLKRLYQSYILQIELLQKYPWLFDLMRISTIDILNTEIEKRDTSTYDLCLKRIFSSIDTSVFKEDLDIESCKQLILWMNIGFTKEVLEDIKQTKTIDYDTITKQLKMFFKELKNVFYK